MIDKEALSIMADIMDGIEQTDEWTELARYTAAFRKEERVLTDIEARYIQLRVEVPKGRRQYGAAFRRGDQYAVFKGNVIAAGFQRIYDRLGMIAALRQNVRYGRIPFAYEQLQSLGIERDTFRRRHDVYRYHGYGFAAVSRYPYRCRAFVRSRYGNDSVGG